LSLFLINLDRFLIHLTGNNMIKKKVRLLNYLSHLFSGMVAAYVVRRWFSTRRCRDFSAKLDNLKKNSQSLSISLSTSGMPIYQWRGKGSSRILCVHGWSGWGGQFADFARIAQKQGCTVFAYDGPGHGRNQRNSSDLIQLRDALLNIVETEQRFDAIVCHSYGLVVVLAAMAAGMRVDRIVSIAAPYRLYPYVEYYFRSVGYSERVQQLFKARVEQQFGKGWWTEHSPDQRVSQVQVPSLLIHDQLDRIVPSGDARLLHQYWVGSQLHVTKGLGHFRILADDDTNKVILRFIKG